MMRKLFLTLALLFVLTLLHAQKVTVDEARSAANTYLTLAERELSFDSLHYRASFYNTDGEAVIHIFDIDRSGFIIMGALRSFVPMVGYSLNGVWQGDNTAPGLLSWLHGYVQDVEAVRKEHNLPKNYVGIQNEWRDIWEKLIERDAASPDIITDCTRSVEPLVQTQWAQGDGYNNYCPVYNNASSYNGRAVTGCVATAMAQIIRYHEYPNVGYGQRSYHCYYGNLSIKFDTAYYDYSLMPNYVDYYTPLAQQNAVSQLCYHCGVAVKMTYENPNHTSGSGAQNDDVPGALKHFGYLNSFLMGKNANDDIWDSLLKHDLDAGLPVYYSGHNDMGGHAFICDGYRNTSSYHFNFGWGGYGDGWYTLNWVNGYSTGQVAVLNIVPSHLAPKSDHYYIAPNSNGDGSSWNSPTSNINDVTKICGLYNSSCLWVKNGTYYGDTSSNVALSLSSGMLLMGGFNGTENSPSERDLSTAATVFSGNSVRKILSTAPSTSSCTINDITFADGYTPSGAVVELNGHVKLERCAFTGNRCDSADGAALYTEGSPVYTCKFHNNHCGAVILKEVAMKNCLVANNEGFGVDSRDAVVDGCDIVCNKGVGIINNGSTKIRNSVLWRNDSSLANNDVSNISFCAIEGLAFELDSNSNFGLAHDNSNDEGTGPCFLLPDTTQGVSGSPSNWHLGRLSPLVDAGDTVRGISYTYDLDHGLRIRNGRTDIGCYESEPPVGIWQHDSEPLLRMYPNPASTMITVEGFDGEVTLFDMMGHRLHSVRVVPSGTPINLSSFPRGIYLLRGPDFTAKIIVE